MLDHHTSAPPLHATPSLAEVKAVVPDHCFERNLARALPHAFFSLVLTVGTGLLAWQFIPLTWTWSWAWLIYAYVNGTIATGVWVIAHECGHRAFGRGTRAQDAIGYLLHSLVLVPYFSWQRSHSIHHGRTNHLVEGETHVPKRSDTRRGHRALHTRRRIGTRVHGVLTIATRLGFGWPTYLLVGSTGGAERGVTNHFWPSRPFSSALFPDRWRRKVRWSSVGVLAMLGLLAWWAIAGSVVQMLAVYAGPYLVVNGWLVTYTWLQHTDQDVPHYADDEWNFVRGAFCSVDRPYGRVADLLHHRIGSTHVAHHLDPRIPHYRAKEATAAIAAAFPHLYRHDPTPVRGALWRVARTCHVVAPSENGWKFTDIEGFDDLGARPEAA
ncbi:MAG: fatty acid desaturase [Acidimicrobiales bacterium]